MMPTMPAPRQSNLTAPVFLFFALHCWRIGVLHFESIGEPPDCLLEIAFDIGLPLSRLEVPFEFAGPISDRLQVAFEFPGRSLSSL